ncbi:MAG: tetratricopeptide repeat protein [Spirochaetales bacterium]|nr:tetratricopeptide repeat protein [Spirochaetales bacterium]
MLSPRQRQEIALNALFTERVLEITETTKVSAEITMDYTVRGERFRQSHVETLRIFDRNAVTWDDDRKAAVFVTTKDPAVLSFSKNIASLIEDKGSRAISKNLRSAIAFYQALGLYGLSYVMDPTTPYKEYSARKTAIDYLQFPRQTLQYKAGDCDDLSVLYCALLESVGVQTAFITLPGHIFMAFSVDMAPEEARKRFYNPNDLIFAGDKAWVPVEVTELKGGFLGAWASGAKQWREALSRNQQGFHPTHEAWQVYEPVGLAGEGAAVELPPSDKILSAYLQELLKFVDREIYPQVTAIQREMRKTGENARLLNKLGVVYARYGLNDEASEQFRKALSKERHYLPSVLNLGNIYYLAGNLSQAKSYYELAHKLSPGNPNALLGVARVNHDLENYGIVSEMYAALRSRDPELAERYAYLEMQGSDAARAAAADRSTETVQWEEP